MDRSTVLQALSAMEQYVVQLREFEDRQKREANDLLSQASQIKQTMAQAVERISRVQGDSQPERAAVAQVERQYENDSEQKKQDATEREKSAQQIQSKIRDAERIVNELKTAEGYMRDYETRAKRWVDEAYNLMRS